MLRTARAAAWAVEEVQVFAGEGGVHVGFADAGDEVEAAILSTGGEVELGPGFEVLGGRDEAV